MRNSLKIESPEAPEIVHPLHVGEVVFAFLTRTDPAGRRAREVRPVLARVASAEFDAFGFPVARLDATREPVRQAVPAAQCLPVSALFTLSPDEAHHAGAEDPSDLAESATLQAGAWSFVG